MWPPPPLFGQKAVSERNSFCFRVTSDCLVGQAKHISGFWQARPVTTCFSSSPSFEETRIPPIHSKRNILFRHISLMSLFFSRIRYCVDKCVKSAVHTANRNVLLTGLLIDNCLSTRFFSLPPRRLLHVLLGDEIGIINLRH